MRIILSDTFSGGSSSCVVCIFIHCRRKNQNHSTMSLTSPVSCLSDVFLLLAFLSVCFTGIAIIQQILFFNDESDDDGSGSGSPGTCAFRFCSVKSVGSVGKSVDVVSGVGSVVFVPTEIESISYFVLLLVSIPRGVDSKGG